MKITEKQLRRLTQLVMNELKNPAIATLKDREDKIAERAVGILMKDLEREKALDVEVHQMMDQMERQNPGEFQRYKMFPLLKKRMAKEKGVII